MSDIFIAALVTQTNTINFAVLYLLHHPYVQKEMYEEINRVVGIFRRVTLEDRQRYD